MCTLFFLLFFLTPVTSTLKHLLETNGQLTPITRHINCTHATAVLEPARTLIAFALCLQQQTFTKKSTDINSLTFRLALLARNSSRLCCSFSSRMRINGSRIIFLHTGAAVPRPVQYIRGQPCTRSMTARIRRLPSMMKPMLLRGCKRRSRTRRGGGVEQGEEAA